MNLWQFEHSLSFLSNFPTLSFCFLSWHYFQLLSGRGSRARLRQRKKPNRVLVISYCETWNAIMKHVHVLFEYFLSCVGIPEESHVLIDFASFHLGVSPLFVLRLMFCYRIQLPPFDFRVNCFVVTQSVIQIKTIKLLNLLVDHLLSSFQLSLMVYFVCRWCLILLITTIESFLKSSSTLGCYQQRFLILIAKYSLGSCRCRCR